MQVLLTLTLENMKEIDWGYIEEDFNDYGDEIFDCVCAWVDTFPTRIQMNFQDGMIGQVLW